MLHVLRSLQKTRGVLVHLVQKRNTPLLQDLPQGTSSRGHSTIRRDILITEAQSKRLH